MNLAGVNLQQQTLQSTMSGSVLKEGQVAHGTIQKLFPDQKAEVQIGNQKMLARLETPLKAGDAHFFQVTGTTPDLSLKVVSGPLTSGSAANQAAQLVKSMGLTDSKEMLQLVKQFLKNETPMSKSELLQAEQLLKSTKVPQEQALQSIRTIVDLKLPMTESSLQAVVQGNAKTGFQGNLQQLQQLIQRDATLSPAMKETLLASIAKLQQPLAMETGATMASNMLQQLIGNASTTDKQAMLAMLKNAGVMPQNANLLNFLSNALGKADSNPSDSVMKALQQLLKNPVDEAMRQNFQRAVEAHSGLTNASKEAMFTALNKVAIAPTANFMTELSNTVTRNLQQAAPQTPAQALTNVVQSNRGNVEQRLQQLAEAIARDPQLTTAQKEALHALISKANGQQLEGKALQQFVKTMQQQLVKSYSDQTIQQAFQQVDATQSAKTNLSQLLGLTAQTANDAFENLAQNAFKTTNNIIAQQLLQQAETQLEGRMNGKTFETIVRQTLENLGLNYEASLANKSTDLEKLQHQLKPQLMHLLQNEQASSATKQAAEQIVARMNGMHYLSGENGPQHQLIMQVPMHFFGKQTDATLQWNGRMKENGKIDPDYARVMFYLDLEALDETIIDMHVQNRVVTVTVYNEHTNLEMLAEPLQQSLEKGLGDKGYQLSAVKVKTFEKVPTEAKATLHATSVNGEGGVDLRI